MNRQQFIHNIELCQKDVRRFLTALCHGDVDIADDLAQETFIKAYINIDSMKDENKFGAWIFRIAYNAFISHSRSMRENLSLIEASRHVSTDNPENVFQYQSLYAALAKLSDKEKYAILLYYMQGYSMAEIAEITNNSEEAVRQQLSRGRKHLKGLLE